MMGLIASPGRGAYAASKYALEAWSDALRMELRHSRRGHHDATFAVRRHRWQQQHGELMGTEKVSGKLLFTPPVNTPSRHGPTRCAWSCVTAVSRSA
jgi:hypothetical protein